MILKWIFDRVVALIGLLFLWPVLLIVAILVKVKMPGGPAFFVQKRVGKDGRLFNCHKFRTMTVKHNGSTVSVAGDSRITPLGAKLRHWKLDELPGLWDVLIGNMSFVGPRPDVPGYADKLQGDDRDVLKLRPGITGPATLKYRLEDEMIADWVSKVKREGSLCEKSDKNSIQNLPNNIALELLLLPSLFLHQRYTDDCLHCAWEEDGVCRRSDIKNLRHSLMKGFSEVDDVMHNTVGCLIGWCMVKGLRFMVKGYNKNHG